MVPKPKAVPTASLSKAKWPAPVAPFQLPIGSPSPPLLATGTSPRGPDTGQCPTNVPDQCPRPTLPKCPCQVPTLVLHMPPLLFQGSRESQPCPNVATLQPERHPGLAANASPWSKTGQTSLWAPHCGDKKNNLQPLLNKLESLFFFKSFRVCPVSWPDFDAPEGPFGPLWARCL